MEATSVEYLQVVEGKTLLVYPALRFVIGIVSPLCPELFA